MYSDVPWCIRTFLGVFGRSFVYFPFTSCSMQNVVSASFSCVRQIDNAGRRRVSQSMNANIDKWIYRQPI